MILLHDGGRGGFDIQRIGLFEPLFTRGTRLDARHDTRVMQSTLLMDRTAVDGNQHWCQAASLTRLARHLTSLRASQNAVCGWKRVVRQMRLHAIKHAV